MHKILKNFMEEKTKMLDVDPDDYKEKNTTTYGGMNIVFNKYGDFNKNLNEDKMVQIYTDVLKGEIVPPVKKPVKERKHLTITTSPADSNSIAS